MTSRAIGQLKASRVTTLNVCRGTLRSATNPLTESVSDRAAIVFVSRSVARLYGAGLWRALGEAGIAANAIIPVPTGEENKTLATVSMMLAAAEDLRIDRRGVFVGIGGGIVLDMVGISASLYRRGVGHIKVGTTLVAQVDAAIGVKCGVNLGRAKNLAGAFHTPEVAIIDGGFLATLSARHIRCGLAEMLKLAVISDAALFYALERDGHRLLSEARDDTRCRALIDRSVAGMLAELRPNVYERSLRRRVDFGHTISARLESESGYLIHHGEAVAIDVAFFCVVSTLLGLMQEDQLQRIVALMDRLGLPKYHDVMSGPSFMDHALRASEAHRGMRLHLPMPTGIGTATFVDDRRMLPDATLRDAIRIVRGL